MKTFRAENVLQSKFSYEFQLYSMYVKIVNTIGPFYDRDGKPLPLLPSKLANTMGQYLEEIHDDVDGGVGGDQQVAEVGHDVLLQAGARRQLLVLLMYGVNIC